MAYADVIEVVAVAVQYVAGIEMFPDVSSLVVGLNERFNLLYILLALNEKGPARAAHVVLLLLL